MKCVDRRRELAVRNSHSLAAREERIAQLFNVLNASERAAIDRMNAVLTQTSEVKKPWNYREFASLSAC